MLAGLSDVPNSSLCDMRGGYQRKRRREGDMHTTDGTGGADEAVSENGETRFPRKPLAPGQPAENIAGKKQSQNKARASPGPAEVVRRREKVECQHD
jgi:hypothetical protein